jgi:lipopolysaccharide export system permease protein
MTTDTYNNFSYAAWDETYKLDMLLFARKARWQKGQWFLSTGQLNKRTTTNDYTVTPFEQTVLKLPENPGQLFTQEHKFSERSIGELFNRANSADLLHKNAAWLEFHKKVSYNVLGLPLLLLGLPMLLLMHQRWGRDLSLAIPSSCFLAFIAWMWWGTLQTMAKAAYLQPVAASWSTHFLVGGLGLFLLRRQDR